MTVNFMDTELIKRMRYQESPFFVSTLSVFGDSMEEGRERKLMFFSLKLIPS